MSAMTQNMCERKTHKIKSMTTISRMGNDFQMVRGTVVAKYRRRFLLPDTAYVTMTIYIYMETTTFCFVFNCET
jgi:hypothetical protein